MSIQKDVVRFGSIRFQRFPAIEMEFEKWDGKDGIQLSLIEADRRTTLGFGEPHETIEVLTSHRQVLDAAEQYLRDRFPKEVIEKDEKSEALKKLAKQEEELKAKREALLGERQSQES